jgi:hypothetical protein
VQTSHQSVAVQPYFMSSLATSLVNSSFSTFTGARTRISFVPQVPQTSPSSSALQNTTSSFSSWSLNAARSFEASSSFPACSTTGALTAPLVTAAPSGHSTHSGGIASSSTTALNVNAPVFFTKQAKPPPNKKKGKEAQSSTEKTQIEYLTTELNFTHSKIVLQDNTIKDLEHKVKIQAERIRISEEKLNSDLHRKYFGLPESSVNPPNPCCSSPCQNFSNKLNVSHCCSHFHNIRPPHCSLSVPPASTCSTCSSTSSQNPCIPTMTYSQNNNCSTSHKVCEYKLESQTTTR